VPSSIVHRLPLAGLGTLLAGVIVFAPTGATAGQRGPAPAPVDFTVSASGDLLMHKPLLDRALANGGGRRYDFAPFFREIRPYVAGIDLGLCHLETPLGPGRPSSYPRFNTPPALARSIRQTGWEACSTASNHSLDRGQRGIKSTVKALDKRGIAHTGSFRSRRDRKRPTILSVQGTKIGFVSYTDATNGLRAPHPWSLNEYPASDPRSGAKKILRDVRRADRAGADAIIVQLHWGDEYARHPNGSQVRVARRLAGSRRVTAIVGQGPHVVQPIRRMRGKFVVFSEGNLVSNQRAATGQPAATQDGLIALLDMRARGDNVAVRRVRYVPIWVRPGDFRVLPAKPGAGRDELRRSYRRTVSVAGRANRVRPVRGN
jgi:poly-gamma-glutamate capsule biosynthesis protein CapA/YwtB (metallophosphatase superfamily)